VETPGVPCSQFDHYACFPASFRSFSPLLTAASQNQGSTAKPAAKKPHVKGGWVNP
jgi:hypothetical protein